jgi:glycine/D-amino acid oxidase-like deaminating enzyme
MKVLVLGAGIIGVTTAHHLAGDGHEVAVIDRQIGPGHRPGRSDARALRLVPAALG